MHILFDIGGTKMRVAFSKDGKTFEKPRVERTPSSFKEGMDLFKSLAEDVVKGRKIKSVSGGISGVFNQKNSQLDDSPNLSGWVKKPLKKTLEKMFKVPVYIENDASVVGLGEAHFGAGKDSSLVSYITVSTGLGGSRIVDGKIDRKYYGFEPGRQYIDLSSGQKRTLESFVSGSSIKRNLGIEAYEISDKKFWDDLAETLAYGLSNILWLWSPEVLVLGGSMIVGSPALDIKRIKFHLKNNKISPKRLPAIKKAKLGDFGGLYGAMVLIPKK